MKKNLLCLILLACFPGSRLFAAPFWYDSVSSYPTGCISTNTLNWFPHQPGSLTANDLLVVNNTYTSGAATSGKRVRVNGLNSEYAMRLFNSAMTNVVTSGVLYASFVVNANFVPGAGAGTYFVAFNNADTNNPPQYKDNGFDFRGRIFEIGGTNAYPFTNTVAGTYHLGIANAAGDPAQGGGPSIMYVPGDFIRNVDYQVVVKYVIDDGNPFDAATATFWVNPASETDTSNMAGPTGDAGAVANGLAGLLLRQRTGGGTVDIRDIAVGTSFADVMTNPPGPVLIATNFNTVTNYAGNPALLEVFATSIGGGPLTYQWYQIVGGVTNAIAGANSQTYVVAETSGSDIGNYFCAVTNSGGIGALSRTNFYISVNTTPTGLAFTTQPASKAASIGTTLTLSSAVSGTGPLTFQWNFNGSPLVDGQPATGQPGDQSLVSGSQTPTLTVSKLSTNETGDFSVTISTTASVSPSSITSSNAHITVNPPAPVSIAFLRTLEDHSTWQASDTASTFLISGVVTTTTNLTSGNTSSYYIQDATAGINLFVTGDNTFRPQRGDLVSASGTLSSFNNTLELVSVAGNPYTTYGVVSANNPLPAPLVFNTALTNNAGLMETNIEGRFVMLTNVYFATAPTATFPSGVTAGVTVTNQNGVPFTIFVSGQATNVVGQAVPRFAWSVLGALNQFKSGAYSSAGYELNLTDMADLVTNPPPPVSVDIAISGGHAVLNWNPVPYLYSYSVQTSSSITGPWTSLASGLTFTNSSGTFTDTNAIGSVTFYRISSP